MGKITQRESIRNDHGGRLPFLVPSLGAHSTKASNAVYTISYANWSHVLRDKSELTIGKKAFVQFFSMIRPKHIFEKIRPSLENLCISKGPTYDIPCDDQITLETTCEPCVVYIALKHAI